MAETAEAAKKCAGRKATLVGTAGDDVLVSKHRDVIWAGPGDDKIFGLGGSDIICGGPGNDLIYGGKGIDRIFGGAGDDRIFGQRGTDHIRGGPGNDYISGGKGTDYLWGNGGNDVILGDTGSDRIRGGGGADILIGGAGNDRIDGGPGDGDVVYGGPGDDSLTGGAGNADHVYGGGGADRVNGGPGDFDVVRGDEGYDVMDGGGGQHDIASFATANPPGAGGFGFDGVYVDLPKGIAYGAGFGVGKTRGTDLLRNIQDVIGSPFDDKIVGDGQDNRIEGGLGDDVLDGGGGSNQIDGGPGSNTCSGDSQQASTCNRAAQPAANTTYVGVGSALDGYSTLYVVGGLADDQITVSYSGSQFIVGAPGGLTTDPTASPLSGGGCTLDATSTVATCSSLSIFGIDSLMLNSGGGNDVVNIDASAPRTLAANLNGGDGNDTIYGGPEDDFIEGGESGRDTLYGGFGDDVLRGGTGGDSLFGGPGDDLMVVSFPCEGTRLIGGSGKDKAGFAPSRTAARARIGAAITSPGVNGCQAGNIARSVKNLEGSKHNDVLIGDNGPNTLLGRQGNDILIAKGGADELDGGPGRDVCNGGAGRDRARSCEVRKRIP